MKGLLNLIQNLGSKTVPAKEELYIRDTIIEMLAAPEAIKLIPPMGDECILVNPFTEIYLIVTDGRIVIRNHDFVVNKQVNTSFSDSLKSLIKDSIQEDVEKIKKEYFANEMDLLRTIYLKNKAKNGDD